MKQSTLDSIIASKVLFTKAEELLKIEDIYQCSAGLIMLQDALELTFLAIIDDLTLETIKPLEKLTFDELVSELTKHGIKIPESMTIKALNKQRVITKHYGKLIDPSTARDYLEAARKALDGVFKAAYKKNYIDVFLTDLLDDSEAKECLLAASRMITIGKHLDALTEIRKAIFLEIEIWHSVHIWGDEKYKELPEEFLSVMAHSGGGHNANPKKKNRTWVTLNVRCPTDYVQINREQLHADAVEANINLADIENIMRLTPKVFRANQADSWCISKKAELVDNPENDKHARYCLDRAVHILIKRQNYIKSRKWPAPGQPNLEVIFSEGSPIYQSARSDSDIIHYVDDQHSYSVSEIVSGFDGENYYKVYGFGRDHFKTLHEYTVDGYMKVK